MFCHGELSDIEQLHEELAWTIIGFVPEAARELRLTCKTLCQHVDHSPDALIIVKKLSIQEEANNNTKRISIAISERRADLFELRLKRHLEICDLPINRLEARRARRGGGGTSEYSISVDAATEPQLLGCLRVCLRKVERVELNECATPDTRRFVSALMEGFNIGSLTFSKQQLLDADTAYIRQLILQFKLNSLEITVFNCAVTAPENLPLDLASAVRSLVLRELGVVRARFFFGIFDDDWAATITSMFEAGRKLDKLYLGTSTDVVQTIFPNTSRLGTTLPKCGKRVWLEVHQSSGDLDRYYVNGHGMMVTPGLFSIKHSTRSDEPAPDMKEI